MIKKRKFKFAPLSGAYMALSLCGILVSTYYIIYPSSNVASIFMAFFIGLFIFGFFRKESSLAYILTAVMGMISAIMFNFSPNLTYGYAFLALFGYMLIASIVSMTVAEPDDFVELEKK